VRKLLPHFIVLLVGGLQVALYSAWHADIPSLERQLAEGTPQEQIHALHVLTNRGSTPHTDRIWDRTVIRELLAADQGQDPLLTDFAYTVDVCRMVKPVWQDAKISARLKRNETGILREESFNDWLRHFLLFRRKVAGRHMGAMLRLKNDEVRWLLASIGGDADTFSLEEREAILSNIHQRQTTSNLSRTKRMAPPDPEAKRERGDNRREGRTEGNTPGTKLPGGTRPGGR